MTPSLQREVLRLLEARTPFALCTVVEARGSVPAKAGARMIVLADGSFLGTIGGAGVEERGKEAGREAIRTGKAQLATFDLQRRKAGGLDSLCGGTVRLFVEPVIPKPHLLMCGGGHVAHAVAALCDRLEYPYSVLDDRPEYASRERFPNASDVSSEPFAAFFSRFDASRFSHLLVLGYTHQMDGEILSLALPVFPGWVGLIGSKSKRVELWPDLQKRGLTEAQLARVEVPVGLPIGAQTPPEIAVSILARLIQHYYQPGDVR